MKLMPESQAFIEELAFMFFCKKHKLLYSANHSEKVKKGSLVLPMKNGGYDVFHYEYNHRKHRMTLTEFYYDDHPSKATPNSMVPVTDTELIYGADYANTFGGLYSILSALIEQNNELNGTNFKLPKKMNYLTDGNVLFGALTEQHLVDKCLNSTVTPTLSSGLLGYSFETQCGFEMTAITSLGIQESFVFKSNDTNDNELVDLHFDTSARNYFGNIPNIRLLQAVINATAMACAYSTGVGEACLLGGDDYDIYDNQWIADCPVGWF